MAYPWIVTATAMVNHCYFYGVDDDFGPFFRKFCSYFPRFPMGLTICHAVRMTVQIAVKLDDGLAEQVRAAAADAGTNLSEWVRAALQYQAAVAKARRARAEEDERGPVYTPEQEAALMAARRRRAIAALDEQ